MKTIELADATAPLAEYAEQAEHDPLIVLRKGQPIAAVVPIEGLDYESFSLGTNPDFVALLQRARERLKNEGAISSEELRRRLGLEAAPAPLRRRRAKSPSHDGTAEGKTRSA